MIEDILNLTTAIINNYNEKWTRIDQFVLHTVKDDGNSFVEIEGLNRSHTALFKIRAKQSDLGLIFKYPCIYECKDALLRKWRLKRMDLNNLRDAIYWDLLKFDGVFDIEYDKFDCAYLKKLLLTWDGENIHIRNNGFDSVYSTELLRRCVIDYDLEEIGLKLIMSDGPLRLNYNWDIFDVYCLIAPKHTNEDKCYLRV